MFVIEKLFRVGRGFVSQAVMLASNEVVAQNYIEGRPREEWDRYRVVPLEVDEIPSEEAENSVIPSEVLIQMMHALVDADIQDHIEAGYLEQYVEEDGSFSYEITELGFDEFAENGEDFS